MPGNDVQQDDTAQQDGTAQQDDTAQQVSLREPSTTDQLDMPIALDEKVRKGRNRGAGGASERGSAACLADGTA